MTEYIERETLKERIFRRVSNGLIRSWLCRIIDELSPADVAPVRHGRWGTHSDRPDSLICSVCNCGFDMWKHDPHNFCPNCSAKMDEEVSE